MKIDQNITVVGGVFILFYLLGLMYPDTFIGFHYPAFLSGKTLLMMAVVLAIVVWMTNSKPFEAKINLDISTSNALLMGGVLIAGGVLFYGFPIYRDIYGDAFGFLPSIDDYVNAAPEHHDKLFSFDITDPKIGTATVTALVAIMSDSLKMTVGDVFTTINIIFGLGYLFFMTRIVFMRTNVLWLRTVLIAMILGAPFLLAFCGHLEVYAPTYFLIALFWFLVFQYVENQKGSTLLFLIVTQIFLIKFHVTGFFLVPILLALLWKRRYGEEKGWKTWNWKQIVAVGLLPIYAMGAFVYFFVTRSTHAPRTYTPDDLMTVLFLPIESGSPAPLDQYNLFSPHHFFDYFQTVVVWSIPAWFLLITVFVIARKYISWNDTRVQLSGFALLMYVPAFFALNPLFAMFADWDLMAIPALTLLVLAIAVLTTIQNPENIFTTERVRILGVGTVVFALLGMSGIFVNASQEGEQKRLLAMAKYEFKTYRLGISTPILESLQMIDDLDERIEAHEKILEELEPYGVKGNDPEMTQLYWVQGLRYKQDKKDEPRALEYFLKGDEFDSLHIKNKFEIIVSCFTLRKFDLANRQLPLYSRMGYPNPQRNLQICAHVAIEANDFSGAISYVDRYLSKWPEDLFFQRVRDSILNAKYPDSIKYLFNR